MAVAIRDKTTSTNQLAVASDGSITASIKGNGAPPARSIDAWTVDQFAFTAASEALLTVTESVNGAATTTFTTRTITNGKTMRLTSISLAIENGGTTPVISRVYVGIRVNTAGAVTASSPLVYRTGVGVAGSARSMTTFNTVLPDGLEYAGNGTVAIGVSAICPDFVTTTQTPKITAHILAYEY